MPFEMRLLTLSEALEAIIREHRPEAMAIEQLFFTTNQKTVIQVAQARGVVLLAAVKAGLPIYEYTPLQVKQAVVGYGKAEKRQVMEMTRACCILRSCPSPTCGRRIGGGGLSSGGLRLAAFCKRSGGTSLGGGYSQNLLRPQPAAGHLLIGRLQRTQSGEEVEDDAYSVRGKLIHTEPGMAVVECGGVGYRLFVTLPTLRACRRGAGKPC
jgi:hypothetical protein